MHCAAHNAEVPIEHLSGDQARLAPFERGVFEVTDRDLNEVPPYQNDDSCNTSEALPHSIMCVQRRQLRQVSPLWQLVDVMSTGV